MVEAGPVGTLGAMSARALWLTRANGLTLLRLLAAPCMALAILGGDAVVATSLFWLAVATDFADGWVARRYEEATPLGGVIDHAVDATFVTIGAAALAYVDALPAPLPFLIAAAFLQYTLDSRHVAARGLRASSLGRWNGIAYYVIVAVPIVRDTLGWTWPEPGFVMLLGWVLVATTVTSMLDRLYVTLRG